MAKRKAKSTAHWHGSLADHHPVSTETLARLGATAGKLTERDSEAIRARVVQLDLTWNQEAENKQMTEVNS